MLGKLLTECEEGLNRRDTKGNHFQKYFVSWRFKKKITKKGDPKAAL